MKFYLGSFTLGFTAASLILLPTYRVYLERAERETLSLSQKHASLVEKARATEQQH